MQLNLLIKLLTSEIFTVNCSEGKIIIIVDYKNFTRDLLLSTLPQRYYYSDIYYMIRYQNLKTNELTYEYNDTIDVHLNKENFEVVFSPIQFKVPIDNQTYFIKAFYINQVQNVNMINTIYPSSSLSFYSKNITVDSNSLSVTHSFSIPGENYQIYVSIVGIINNEFIGYSIGKNEEYPFTNPKDKSYNHYTISDINQVDTYLLINKNNRLIYEIEFMGESSNYSLQYALETFTFYPTFKNSTLFTITESNFTFNGKNVIYVQSSRGIETQILIHFFYTKKQSSQSLNSFNQEENMNLKYCFKYNTISYNEKENYMIDKEYSIYILHNVLDINFKELFENTYKVKESKYIVEVFDQNSINDVNVLNTINLDILNSHAIVNKTFITENKGKSYYYSLQLPSNSVNDYYVALIGYFTMDNNEDIIINYGIKTPSYYNRMFVFNYLLLGLGIIAVIGAIYYVFCHKKEN